MTQQELEDVYAALAHRIDAVGPDNCQLFLAKLSLLLAYENGDAEKVADCIDAAAASLSLRDI
ncbi:hypothetical protein MACH17_42600 [Phaeobacter inhibens]|jgi:hypothetical protein|uniref:hypothetical protein n=1 Tax=Rhodobacterales TaxID=204455 RepID=UPI000068A06D|nr:MULTISPECIES: hypothetical protein [Roseobacteraceae]EAQ43877.1 hypothetical protein MED193_00025 [Roseobacter sp. MED193]GLO72743.1 hypothetical protein MACH17_42600 [Phaeobacter inhibens]